MIGLKIFLMFVGMDCSWGQDAGGLRDWEPRRLVPSNSFGCPFQRIFLLSNSQGFPIQTNVSLFNSCVLMFLGIDVQLGDAAGDPLAVEMLMDYVTGNFAVFSYPTHMIVLFNAYSSHSTCRVVLFKYFFPNSTHFTRCFSGLTAAWRRGRG